MSKRRAGRVAALQVLYGLDIRGALAVDEGETALQRQLECLGDPDDDDLVTQHSGQEASSFAAELCRGVLACRERIDRLLERCSDNWRLERMSCVDRNVLRLASYELAECPDVPPGVTINEAIELGKAFGSRESGGFINGVLDRVARELGR